MVSSTASQQLPKKTMAVALVESTMKKSVALVTKEIAISAGVDEIQYGLEGYSTTVSSMQIEASGSLENEDLSIDCGRDNMYSGEDFCLIDSCVIYYLIQISQGHKVYKLDWMFVWQFFVSHREPSLLPRQLLVAFGTQRSYK
ncbi:hypothetical protein CFP56_029415 [Quercus suber]|uniref:Uncharacterized protein n=1 Tax=Quercus suber TaxID=58331 RepID=A0AAW0JSZ4_QUESU